MSLFDPNYGIVWMTPAGHDLYMERQSSDAPVVADQPKKCRECERELCAELDAYYGHHQDGAGYCDRCRRKLKIP